MNAMAVGTPGEHRVRRAACWTAALGLLGLLACRDAPDDTGAPSSGAHEPEPELAVAVHGCDLIVEPGARRCLRSGPTVVSLWIAKHDGRELALRLDGEPVDARTHIERDGTLLSLELGPFGGELELRDPTHAPWHLRVVPHSLRYKQLRWDIVDLGMRGELEQAHALLDVGLAELPADEAAHLGCVAAQLAYASDALDEVIAWLRTSPAVGCYGIAQLIAAQGHLYEQPDLNAAQRSIDEATAAGAQDLGAHVNALFHQADLNLFVGRVDESIAGFDRVIRLAPLIDELDTLRSAQVMKTIALARLGRFAEADTLAAELEAALGPADADERDEIVIDVRYNLAWTALLRREDDPAVPDPSAALARLIELYEARGETKSIARTQLHLALAAAQNGDFDEAEAELASVDRSLLTPFELVWLELVGGRVALGRAQLPEAEQRIARAETFAALDEDLELTWLTTIARARLARAQGRLPDALAAHERAAELADQLALSVPGTAGRSLLVTAHGRADAEHVELLLELDRVEQALCVAAGSRARHLRALWARLRPAADSREREAYNELLSRYEARRRAIDSALEQAWSLSADELARLQQRLQAEGERADALLLRATALLERDAPRWSCERVLPRAPERAVLTMIADADHRRWWFLLARGQHPAQVVELASEPPSDPRTLAAEAMRALAPELRGVEVLGVIPVGAFVAVDLQRVLLELPELAGIDVRTSLGLGRVDDDIDSQPPEQPRRAAVVAGASDLAAVNEEAARVSQALRSHDWTVEQHWSPIADAQPTLLHYSGHGRHAGLAGWDSTIEIPGHGPRSAAQIVAAQRAPSFVVLGACSAGSSNAEIIDGGMNLAAAFLLAGAELVIAPTGPVDDEAALALATALYREPPRAELDALAHALVQLQRAEHAAGEIPAGPRSALRWRAWVP